VSAHLRPLEQNSQFSTYGHWNRISPGAVAGHGQKDVRNRGALLRGKPTALTVVPRSLNPTEPDIDFSVNKSPFPGVPQAFDQVLKIVRVFGGVFKPGQEIKPFAKLTAVMKKPRGLSVRPCTAIHIHGQQGGSSGMYGKRRQRLPPQIRAQTLEPFPRHLAR
jgi:hypothetical protein